MDFNDDLCISELMWFSFQELTDGSLYRTSVAEITTSPVSECNHLPHCGPFKSDGCHPKKWCSWCKLSHVLNLEILNFLEKCTNAKMSRIDQHLASSGHQYGDTSLSQREKCHPWPYWCPELAKCWSILEITKHTHTQSFYCSSGICPGPSGWAGTRKVKTRKVKPVWIYWSKR